mmetsp:Transcript_48683/g.83109  ORF Transcript_48683/g.83109 Transcript_48683/m.83109 type:complete len:175 (-) Transcript_48683:107-631(-)
MLGSGETLRTGSLRDEIRAMEERVMKLVGPSLALRRALVHSAIVEDGRLGDAHATLTEAGPWVAFKRDCRHHADVEWRDTLRNMAVCGLVAKFGAHGPQESAIILGCAVGLVVWQMRATRLFLKLLLSLAAENRGSYLVDLFSTLLPTSHQALLAAEEEASEGDASEPPVFHFN